MARPYRAASGLRWLLRALLVLLVFELSYVALAYFGLPRLLRRVAATNGVQLEVESVLSFYPGQLSLESISAASETGRLRSSVELFPQSLEAPSAVGGAGFGGSQDLGASG